MIVGVTGTNGAGKGALVEYLVENKGFTHYSGRALITEEIKRRGLPIDRSSMREVANDLRTTLGPAYIAETYYNRAIELGRDAIIESIRAVKEAEFLKKKGAYLFAVDANRHVRYERIVKRGSSTDTVDFDTWVAQEEREWGNTDVHDMNVPVVMQMADFAFHNDGTLEEFHSQIDEILKKITK